MVSIRTNYSAASALASLAASQARTSQITRQMSTGLKVETARDDAAVWSAGMSIRADRAVMTEALTGMSAADTRLSLVRTAAESAAKLLTQASPLASTIEDGTGADVVAARRDFDSLMAQAKSVLSSASSAVGGTGRTERVVVGAEGNTVSYDLPSLTDAALGFDQIDARLAEMDAAASVVSAQAAQGAGVTAVLDLDEDGPRASIGSDGNGIAAAVGTYQNVGTASLPNDDVAMLVDGTKWGGAVGTGATITYSFYRAGVSTYHAGYIRNAPSTAFEIGSAGENAVRAALALWSKVANVSFVEVADTGSTAGEMRFAGTATGTTTAFAFTPWSDAEAGDVWLSDAKFGASANPDWSPNGYEFQTIIHEIGHALGLKHPHDPNEAGTDNYDGAAHDDLKWSVMSYKDFEGDTTASGYTTYDGWYPTTPQLADVRAIQYLYGANTSANAGDTAYSWASGATLRQTIVDGSGEDTIDWSNQSSAAGISLKAGTFSQLGPQVVWWTGSAWGYDPNTLAIADNAVIEDAKGGSAADSITGNDANNKVWGNGGGDTLVGSAGDDELDGGTGTDKVVYSGNRSAYTIQAIDPASNNGFEYRVSKAGGGTDLLRAVETVDFADQAGLSVAAIATPIAVSTPPASPVVPPVTPPVVATPTPPPVVVTPPAPPVVVPSTPTVSAPAPSLRDGIAAALKAVVAVAASVGTAQAGLNVSRAFGEKLAAELDEGLGAMVDADMTAVAARAVAEQVRLGLASQMLGIANSQPQALLALFQR